MQQSATNGAGVSDAKSDNRDAATTLPKDAPESEIRLRTRLTLLPASYPDVERPRTVGDCHRLRLGTRHQPCGFVSCEWNLLLDGFTRRRALANGRRSLQQRYEVRFDLDAETPPMTCALRAANRGGMTLEQVGEFYSLTRERVRQIEEKALRKVRDRCDRVRADRGELGALGESDEDLTRAERASVAVARQRAPRKLERCILSLADGLDRIEVVRAAAERLQRKYSTVQTMVSRMVEDGRLLQDRGRLWATGDDGRNE